MKANARPGKRRRRRRAGGGRKPKSRKKKLKSEWPADLTDSRKVSRKELKAMKSTKYYIKQMDSDSGVKTMEIVSSGEKKELMEKEE